MMLILGWAKLIPLRDWLGAAAFMALFIFVLCWDHHERNIGATKCEAKHEAADVRAQDLADKAAPAASAQLHADVAQITAPLPAYLTIYADTSKPPDCPEFKYVRKSTGGLKP